MHFPGKYRVSLVLRNPNLPLQVASKPTETLAEITRPSKRGRSGKGPAAAAAGGAAREEEEEDEEEDVEMVGTKGGSELPHNRFDCPEVCINALKGSTRMDDILG